MHTVATKVFKSLSNAYLEHIPVATRLPSIDLWHTPKQRDASAVGVGHFWIPHSSYQSGLILRMSQWLIQVTHSVINNTYELATPLNQRLGKQSSLIFIP